MSTYPNFVHYHFIDPAPNFDDLLVTASDEQHADRDIIISGTKRDQVVQGRRLGEFAKLHPTSGRALVTSGTNAWYVDAGGEHVLGQLSFVPGNYYDSSMVMSQLGDGTWVLAQLVNRAGDGWMCRIHGASDGLTGPMGSTGRTYSRVPLTRVFRAASWATELFPKFNDSDGVVQLKLELAKRNWLMRRAQYALHVQAEYRSWTNLLPDLAETGFGLPTAERGFIVTGDALLPVRVNQDDAPQFSALSTREQERLSGLRARGGNPVEQVETFSRVGFTLPVTTSTDAQEAPHSSVISAFVARFEQRPESVTNLRNNRYINSLRNSTTL